MPKFIWKAKDQHGRETVQRLNAATAEQARDELLSRGFNDLRLQQEEIAAMSEQGVREASSSEYYVEQTPQQEADAFDGKTPGFWGQWWQAAKEVPGSSVIWMGLLGLSIYWGKTWLIVLNVIVLCFSLLPVLIFPFIYLWFGRSLRLYNQLNAAKVWSRWPEVYALADELEKAAAKTNIGVPDWEIARCKAQALAGMNRLEEGLRLFNPFANDKTLEHWTYLAHLAAVHDIVQDYRTSLQLRTQAAAEKPDNMNTWIDLAMHHAHRMGDAASAREAFAKVDVSLVAELGKPYLRLVEGMILCREARHGEAKPLFEEALKGFDAYRHNPLILSVVLLTESYICLAHATSGDRARANTLWKRVRPYLQAGREDDMIQRIQAALGGRVHQPI